MDFTELYMPAAAELTQEELYDTRTRLEAYCLSVAPDVETNPNTVVGDLIITPQSYVLAAMEKGLDRLMSDLDLTNVAAGNVNNCEFVAQWLNNFAVDPSERLRASGVVRMTFTENKEYVLDRSTRFISGDSIYSIYLPNKGEYTIYRPNSEMPEGINGTVMKDTGTGTYFADVVVIGETTGVDTEAEEGTETETQAITTGGAFELSVTIPELESCAALIDFDPGSETISIPDLARRAQVTLHSASLNTRNGAIQYINTICPFVDGVYATHNGDREMLRDYDNPLGISMGCLDLYVRSKGYNFTETQQLLLYYNESTRAFEGDFPYVGQPYHMESVTNANVDAVNLKYDLTSTFAPINEHDMYPGARAAYTSKEKMTISIPDVTDERGDSKFSPSIDLNGKRYAIFTLTYQTDPMLQAIAQTVENEDYAPVNTSVLVRGFIPVIIERYEVEYVRDPGIVPDLDTARTKIKEYMGNLGAPNVYSDAEIAHIMRDCGAKYTKGVNVYARVQWVLGNKVQNRKGEIVDVMEGPTITTSDGLRIEYPSENLGLSPDDMYVCSVRNIRYWFLEGALTFKEVRDI